MQHVCPHVWRRMGAGGRTWQKTDIQERIVDAREEVKVAIRRLRMIAIEI